MLARLRRWLAWAAAPILDPNVPTPEVEVPNCYVNQKGKASAPRRPTISWPSNPSISTSSSRSAAASISTSAPPSPAFRRRRPRSGSRNSAHPDPHHRGNRRKSKPRSLPQAKEAADDDGNCAVERELQRGYLGPVPLFPLRRQGERMECELRRRLITITTDAASPQPISRRSARKSRSNRKEKSDGRSTDFEGHSGTASHRKGDGHAASMSPAAGNPGDSPAGDLLTTPSHNPAAGASARAIQICLGRARGSGARVFRYKAEKLFSVTVPVIPSGLPSDILCRRPDIASAEALLAQWQIRRVLGARGDVSGHPAYGPGGFQSAALASLFQPQNAFYNMAVGITQPITNEYRLQASARPQQGHLWRVPSELSQSDRRWLSKTSKALDCL